MTLGKLTIPLLALAPILAGAAGAGSVYAVTAERLEQLQRQQAETAATVNTEKERSAEARTKAAEQALTLKYLEQAMRRIERKLGTVDED